MGPKHAIPRPFPRWVPWAAFAIGITASVSYRLIIVAKHLDPAWIRPLWYVAVCGNSLFFLYRYIISQRRQKVVIERGILEKLKNGCCLSPEDCQAVRYLVYSTVITKEKWNYFVIFASTILAILFDLLWPG
ncbi:hypothetical protein [Thermosulfuriphilus sp.]